MSIECCKSYVGKQVIGALPNGGNVARCDNFYIISFNDPQFNSFTGWELNGYFDYDWYSLAASFGGTYILDFTGNSAPPFSPPSQATFIYQGETTPPPLSGKDSFGNVVSYTWKKYCNKTTHQFTYLYINNFNISTIKIGDLNIDLLLYGGPALIGDITTLQTIINGALQTYFGANAYCVIFFLPGNALGYTITYLNIYADSCALNGTSTGNIIYNASDIDMSTLSLSFSKISYNQTTLEYMYAVSLLNGIAPSTFLVGLYVEFNYPATLSYSYNLPLTNGQLTTNTPSSYLMVNSLDKQFIGGPNNSNLAIAMDYQIGVDWSDKVNIYSPWINGAGYVLLQQIDADNYL